MWPLFVFFMRLKKTKVTNVTKKIDNEDLKGTKIITE